MDKSSEKLKSEMLSVFKSSLSDYISYDDVLNKMLESYSCGTAEWSALFYVIGLLKKEIADYEQRVLRYSGTDG